MERRDRRRRRAEGPQHHLGTPGRCADPGDAPLSSDTGDAGDDGVTGARPEELPRLVDDLVEAFLADPVHRFVFRDPDRQRRHGRSYFALHARRSVRAGFAWRSAGGAALWDPPQRWRTSTVEDLGLVLRCVRGTGLRHGRRIVGDLLAVEKAHPREDHLYLAVLGVRPDRQGHGLGSRLLAPGLEYAETHHLPCYLESSNPRNHSFYERHGFEVTGEHRIADGPVITSMWRRAAS